MSLKCGIVGLPNVGKSTLFNCVSSGKAQSANFPFCTIEPNLGSTNVPDKRLDTLVEICKPKSVVPATVDIVDIAGLVKAPAMAKAWATNSWPTSANATPSCTSCAVSTMATSSMWTAAWIRCETRRSWTWSCR